MRQTHQKHFKSFPSFPQKFPVNKAYSKLSTNIYLQLQKLASNALNAIIILYCVFLYDYSNPIVTFVDYSAVTAQTDGQSQLTSVPVSTRLCLFKPGSLPLGNVFPPRWGNESTLPCALLLLALSHCGWETDTERESNDFTLSGWSISSL